MKGTYSVEIERSQEDVFDFLADPDNIKIIVPNLVEHGHIEEKPEIVGTTFYQVFEEKGRRMKMTGVVTEHVPPTSMAVKMQGSMFRLEVRYVLESLGPTRTKLIQHSDASFKHVFKLMGLLFGGKMKREGEKVQAENFARMKNHLESGATSAPAEPAEPAADA